MFGFRSRWPTRQLARVRTRYAGRSLIVHSGFPEEWLEELLKQPGGGAYFRLDSRHLPVTNPTPVEWLVQNHVLPLGLPQPLFLRFRERDVLVRHLDRNGRVVHPSEIAWFLEELDARHHARLRFGPGSGAVEAMRGIPVNDNEALSMLEHLAG